MTEFVGRTGSHRSYSYPETRRSGGSNFARNFATGPKSETGIEDGIQIPWNAIDAGGTTPGPDVPITPLSTGVLLISGVVTAFNSSGAPLTVTVAIQVNGVSIPVPSDMSSLVEAGSSVAIPFMGETDPSDTPVGQTSNIQIFVTSDPDVGSLLTDSSALSIQEVSVATG